MQQLDGAMLPKLVNESRIKPYKTSLDDAICNMKKISSLSLHRMIVSRMMHEEEVAAQVEDLVSQLGSHVVMAIGP